MKHMRLYFTESEKERLESQKEELGYETWKQMILVESGAVEPAVAMDDEYDGNPDKIAEERDDV